MANPIIHLTFGKANPDRANGINVIVHGLAGAFQRRGMPVEVWGITPSPNTPTFERTYPLRLFQRTRSRFLLDSALRKALHALPTSAVVHLHGGLLPEFYAVTRILRKRGIDWVLMPHGCYSKAALGLGTRHKRAYIHLFDKRVIQGAKHIQLGATDETNGLSDMVRPGQAVVIPNGYDQPEAPFASPGARPFRFSFCGRLAAYHKGLDLLANAFASAAHGVPDMHLDLIGDGPDRDQIVGLLQAPYATGQVTLHGALFAEAKREALVNSSCFVLTSRHEGFPMALLEAASLGLPLLVTEATNFAGYVRDWGCGIVIPELTESAIAKGLVEMASTSPERLREMGDASVRLIREELNWDHVIEKVYEHAYEAAE